MCAGGTSGLKRGGALVLVEHRAFSSVTAQLLGALGELVGEEGVPVGERRRLHPVGGVERVRWEARGVRREVCGVRCELSGTMCDHTGARAS